MRLRHAITACILALASLSASVPADARGNVAWTRVEVPDGPESARVAKRLRSFLNEAAKKADFGKTKVEASVRVVELSWSTHGDVVRMTCAVVGRLKNGQRAKSRISFGGDPAKKDELEKQVLSSVSAGLVARLAQMARARAD
jgi:hypothetical protein